jgi:hypothetical protein
MDAQCGASMSILTIALLIQLATAAVGPVAPCGSAMRSWNGRSVDLAPPAGFVEICQHDAELCRKLTASYPPNVTTLGYFVTEAEWKAHAQNPAAPFSRYLIAQLAPAKTAAHLQQVKSFIRSQQEPAPDRAHLAERFNADGQVGLGILDETAESISIGAVARVPTPGARSDVLVMTNSALALGPDLLSLYVYLRVDTVAGSEQIEPLTKRWLQCLRDANGK